MAMLYQLVDDSGHTTKLYSCTLVGGLEHFYFSIYWEFHHPN